MLGLYYAPGACSMAAHIVLEESGEKYEPIRLDLAKGEQRSEAYLKLNPLGGCPCCASMMEPRSPSTGRSCPASKNVINQRPRRAPACVAMMEKRISEGPKAQERPSLPGSDLVPTQPGPR